MKLLIYTLPFKENFGGILQAFALQEVLKNYGHQVMFLNRRKERKNRILEVLVWMKWRLSECILYKIHFFQTIPFFGVIPFKNKYLNVSSIFFKEDKIVDFCQHKSFDGYIVGSDQIWRYGFAPDIKDSFLSFTKGIKAIKISYAASFGTDDWNYPLNIQRECADLVREFNMVTVREDSGVELCQKYLNCNASSVLDPTLLIDHKVYEKVINESAVIHHQGIFCYILDRDEYKQNIIDKVKSVLKKEVFYMNTSVTLGCCLRSLVKRTYMTIPQWLVSFKDADFIITDSFHGTVFSIIFKKPFATIGNSERGLARFQSLLSKFGLQNRLIRKLEDIEDLLKNDICWSQVERKHIEYADYSRNLLLKIFK